ncbi:MAG: response regulator transcription factor [Planctomycetota bacterium]
MCLQMALHIDHNYQRQTHIRRHLETLGFKVHRASSTSTAWKFARGNRYRLVLMHFETTGSDVFEFCSFLRAGCAETILIVLMRSAKIAVIEKLFDYGANDVVTGAEASARILTKRICAHLFRNRTALYKNGTVRLRNTIVDFHRREVWCNGTIRKLRGISADLLKYFLDNPNRPVSREELLHCHIWADSVCSSAREGGKTFDMHVGKLRKIIEPDPTRPQIITSVRGVGWKLSADPS